LTRVMIADDSNAIRLVLQDMLAIGHHELVAEAIDGQDTVEKFAQFYPEVLLLDLAMPKKNGLQVIQELIPKFPEAKIVVVTASGSDSLIDQCLEAGAVNYISKPFDTAKILKAVDDVIGK